MRRARRCSPAIINSIWPISSWPSATVSSTVPGNREPKKAAVLGSPIAHSRSPQLHLAAYRALGLTGWTYDRIECDADELPSVVSGLGPDWVGVSVTMPGKFAALRFADERTGRAELVGSANTLLRTPRGWRADNTDVDGVKGALGAVTRRGRRRRIGRHRSGGDRRHWPNSASPTSPSPPATRTRRPGWSNWPGSVPRPGPATRRGAVSWARRWPTSGRGQHDCPPRWPRDTPTTSPPRRYCWTRSTTRGRRRWPRRWPPRAAG